MNENSNAHKCVPAPEGLARGLLLLLDKRLAQYGLNFDCKAYIDEDGLPCVQVYVDNDDDPEDVQDLHFVIDNDDLPDELYAAVREELEEIYDFEDSTVD